MIVLTSKQMREVEKIAIEKIGIPSICLMENAGRETALEVKKILEEKNLNSVIIISGKGNNGGDGYVVARNLYNWGADVKVFLTTSIGAISGDAKVNLDAILNMGIYVAEITQREHLKFLEKAIKESDVIVDAIYGIGLKGRITGIVKDIIEMINQANKIVVSVDIPSGLNADTGKIEGCAIKASKTVTMQFVKPGLLVYPGVDYAGEVRVAEIGIPCRLAAEIGYDYNLVTSEDVKLPKRLGDTHKGDYGKALIIAGSKNMTGAAYLCAKSAIKTGCGLVKLAVPQSAQSVIQGALYEVITYGLEEKNGILSYNALSSVLKLIDESDVIAIGPGLTHDKDISQLVYDIVKNVDKPVVLDADALNALVGRLEVIQGKRIILTPHYGEMSRLTGLTTDEIKNNLFEVAKTFIDRYKVTLVLKGAKTVIATKEGSIYINSTGNPGMATAGSGDVLTGMITAFLAQGFSEEKAAIYGVFYHGKAGDIAREYVGEYGMTAMDILENIPDALKCGL
ncbi:bifunctional ADP-dependent NAD(P)H-hydrate dehydratase/NAD(P)H-hydrate epimerase [Thermoanaerobacter sp. CM-CNRG TB177]|uniref:bifunctional ADP-dependent NAD(P)H-hydrate dehydratase/NAD(P)H-hydrate epimerase n=1 Tax=Thermoanaerobacter TaxID=1754 RepID=UPI00048FE403|nr:MULTISPECIES: bifunctional ADP-dependent NAD(P)H-hydrate dehydratase/NAD(P)H-hydrate epimerase [Thermoanaerobacter]MBT1278641.1 bifunctional ADP-dependent NAD(P)H-hydrate dehydratase/NAD(P)H-hydrate epimerase [Thermoanaerobacter sp. CM-CNRG TB177]